MLRQILKVIFFLTLLTGISLFTYAQKGSTPINEVGKAPEQVKVVRNNKPAPLEGWSALFNDINSLLKDNNTCDTNSFALFEVELDTNGKVKYVDAIWEVLSCRKGRKLVFEKLTKTAWDVSNWDFKTNPECKVLVPADLHFTDVNISRMATHPIGMQKFYAKIGQDFNYPSVCLEAGLSGFVVLQFMVDKDGSLHNIRSVNGDSGCKPFVEEAIRVLKKQGRWIPGKQAGSFVKMQLKLPIRLEAN